MWLSDRDYLNGMRAAIDAKNVKFEALNLMSDNPGMRWDIESTKEKIGYRPQDGHVASVSPFCALRAATVKLLSRTIPSLSDKYFSEW